MSLTAAFGACEYTPPPGSPFGRMSHHPTLAEGVHSPLFANLVLIGDGRNTVGLLALDQIRLRRMEAVAFRRVLARALDAPPTNFLIAATHTHNSPALSPWRPSDTGFAVLNQLAGQVDTLARQVRSRMQPVALNWARCAAPGIAYNRRAVYRAADGREQVATHGKRDAANFLRVEDADEDELRVLLMRDARGEPMGCVVNFPCHPTTMYNVPQFSSDYPGVLRDALSGEIAAPVMFVTGFAGDQSPKHDCETTGQMLADAATAALRDSEPIDDGAGVAASVARLRIKVRVPTPRQVNLAWDHLEQVMRGESPPPLIEAMYGYAFAFHRENPGCNEWLAREIIARWELFRRGEVREPTEQVEVQAMRIGDAAIAGFPGEPFACFGRQMRERSAIKRLLCIEHANGFAGYLPPPDAFTRGGYECCLADQSRLAPNAGPRMVKAALGMIERF